MQLTYCPVQSAQRSFRGLAGKQVNDTSIQKGLNVGTTRQIGHGVDHSSSGILKILLLFPLVITYPKHTLERFRARPEMI